jgi:hypothetical protein
VPTHPGTRNIAPAIAINTLESPGFMSVAGQNFAISTDNKRPTETPRNTGCRRKEEIEGVAINN